MSFEMGTHELTQGVGSIVNPGGSRNTSNDTMLQKWEISADLTCQPMIRVVYRSQRKRDHDLVGGNFYFHDDKMFTSVPCFGLVVLSFPRHLYPSGCRFFFFFFCKIVSIPITFLTCSSVHFNPVVRYFVLDWDSGKL